jgi:hypothetical protein
VTEIFDTDEFPDLGRSILATGLGAEFKLKDEDGTNGFTTNLSAGRIILAMIF